MRKNEMFVIIDSLFSERMDYWIELLCVFRSRFSRIDSNEVLQLDCFFGIKVLVDRGSKLSIDDYTKMADQERSDFYVVFTMSLCALGLKH